MMFPLVDGFLDHGFVVIDRSIDPSSGGIALKEVCAAPRKHHCATNDGRS
jgi:hypothetical protein